MNIKYIHPADQLVMFMQRIYDKGLTTTTGGNLSIMDADGNIWITPAAVDKGTLTRKDIICVHPDGTTDGPHRPSSELPFHASVYKMRPDIKAVLHAHPPALIAFSIVRKVPNLDMMPSLRPICREAKIATYGVPGSDDLGKKIGSVFQSGCDIAILENHGVCIGAQDMFTAFRRFETLNYAAELEILSAQLGSAKPLTEEQLHQANTHDHTNMGAFTPQRHTSKELSARRDMLAFIKRAYRQGLFTASHGTYSVRLDDGSFLITPYGMDRAYLEEEDLVWIRDDQKEAGKAPSRAVRLHSLIYKHNPHVRAILQAHPLHAMAFAVTGGKLDPRTIPESYVFLRDMQTIPYSDLFCDQEKVAKMFVPAQPALLAENSCAIVTGGTLLQAFDRLEVLEATAHSIIQSRSLGSIVHITDSEIADLKIAFHLED